MWKVFAGFALFAVLCRIVLPSSLGNLCQTMMLIYLAMALIAAVFALIGQRRADVVSGTARRPSRSR